jgi:hypothetical protein
MTGEESLATGENKSQGTGTNLFVGYHLLDTMYCIYLACRMHVFDRAIVVVTSVRYLKVPTFCRNPGGGQRRSCFTVFRSDFTSPYANLETNRLRIIVIKSLTDLQLAPPPPHNGRLYCWHARNTTWRYDVHGCLDGTLGGDHGGEGTGRRRRACLVILSHTWIHADMYSYQHHSINYTHMSVTMGPFHSSLAAWHAYSVMPRRVALLRYIFLLFYCLPSHSSPRSLTRLFSDHVAITL